MINNRQEAVHNDRAFRSDIGLGAQTASVTSHFAYFLNRLAAVSGGTGEVDLRG